MPFIAFELDALRNVHHAARAAQLEPALVSHGLLQMWEWCWREKQDSVNATHLRGFFGGVAPSDALTAFGFLEETDVGKFRVRGTERYLRLGRARSKGGHAAKGNLKRGPSRGTSPAAAGSQPGNSPGCAPALTASSEQRAANSFKERTYVGDEGTAAGNKTQLSPAADIAPKAPAQPVAAKTAHVPSVPSAPTAPREGWLFPDFWAWAQHKRHQALLVPEPPPNLTKGAGWWSAARSIASTEELCEGFYRFGEDPHWQSTTPKLPFAGFQSQWTRYVELRRAQHAPEG